MIANLKILWHKSIDQTPPRSGISWGLASILFVTCNLFAISGCSYRFANLDIRLPRDIQTIAIESIFDTSRQVLPHHILWTELQRAVITEGHLKLVTTQKADIYLRAHINKAWSTFANVHEPQKQDEPSRLQGEDGTFTLPSDFENLRQADRYAQDQHFTMVVTIEVWHLRTRKRVFIKDYPIASTFKPDSALALASVKSLRSDEIFEYHFSQSSENTAKTIVRDLIDRIRI